MVLGSWAGTASADPWPGNTGTEIGNVGSPGGLPALYEPSGAVWHERLGVLLVVSDGGSVSRLDADGQNVTTWMPGANLEGNAIADPQSDLVYLGHEHPDSVHEFDLSTGTLTGNSWDLTPWITGPGSPGLEGLTYVDGLFYAATSARETSTSFDCSTAASSSRSRCLRLPPVGTTYRAFTTTVLRRDST